MSEAAQEQIRLLSQQRDRLMKSVEEAQSAARSDGDDSEIGIDADALNFAVHTALTKAMANKSSEDHSRFQRTIDDLQSRLAAAEVRPFRHDIALIL